LVGVITLRKVKLTSFFIFSVIYFIFIWTLPAAWIWNPTGWLYKLGMRDFAGGLVVHGAAGAAGLAFLIKIYKEEKSKKRSINKKEQIKINDSWLSLSILLLLMGWFGFNPGSVLAFNDETLVVVINTFLAAGTAMLSTIGFRWIDSKRYPDILDSVNGILMGLIIITPLAGFVSPVSSIILGFLGGPLFIYAEKTLSKIKWMDDPVGLLPGHATGGLFGVVMIAFFTQKIFASASGNPTLPNGLLFGGGYLAVKQLGIEFFGIVVVIIFVFVVSYFCLWVIGKVSGGITY